MRLLLENVNAVVVAAGLFTLESGIALTFSLPVALIVLGVLLMTAGLYPYVRPMRKP